MRLLAVLFIDVDHFKQFNDHYGHAATIPGPDSSPLDLLKAADTALYQAKASGRRRALGAVESRQPDWAPEPHQGAAKVGELELNVQ